MNDTQVDSITIPIGPRLGNKVIDVKGLTKSFGDRVSWHIFRNALVSVLAVWATWSST